MGMISFAFNLTEQQNLEAWELGSTLRIKQYITNTVTEVVNIQTKTQRQ